MARHLEMLEEAVEVMRALWTGEVVNHDGKYYVVEHARIYSMPDEPPAVYVSAFGPAALEVAARIADGFITTKPSAEDLRSYREHGGKGPAQGGVKVCYGTDEAAARRTAHRLWANSGVPGELAQVLRTPEHFMQVSELVTEEMTGESVVCGPDVDAHVQALRSTSTRGTTRSTWGRWATSSSRSSTSTSPRCFPASRDGIDPVRADCGEDRLVRLRAGRADAEPVPLLAVPVVVARPGGHQT